MGPCDLHHQALPFVHQGADAFDRRAFAQGNFRSMDKRGTIQADVDEGGLHPRQHAHNLALVDIADDPALLGALHVDFLQNTVLYHRHARFHRRDIDQNLFTHGWVSFRRFHNSDRSLKAGRSSRGVQRTVRFCQQGMPNWPSSCAVSHTGRPTTAE